MTYSASLNSLLSVIGLQCDDSVIITSLALDSRHVQPGALFFACKGHQANGHDYVLDAQAKGAVAILFDAKEVLCVEGLDVPSIAVEQVAEKVGVIADAFYQSPSKALQVFGITGTNGKTTCCHLLTQAFGLLGTNAAMIGTIGVGSLADLQDSDLTTPDAIQLHQTLARMRENGVTQVCMEVSSHALQQKRVAGIQFYAVMFTNLSHDHLDYHGDMAAYGLAKARLFRDYPSSLAITNATDELGAQLLDGADTEFAVSYGRGGDVYADEVTLTEDGIELLIEGNGVEFVVKTPLVGRVNVPNIELLVATLLGFSVEVAEIQRITTALRPVPGRMELYKTHRLPRVVVDYAHTPDALKKALDSIRAHCKGRLYCVFGAGGDRDQAKRAVMGKAANDGADVIIVTNDNPRSEDPMSIARAIVGGMDREATIILDRASAIRAAIEEAHADDWVLVAGKGHESTQEISGKKHAFSDREQVELALSARGVA